MKPGKLLACFVDLFVVGRLLVLVDFFLAVAARVEGLLAVVLPAVARAGFFRVAVELRRTVFVVAALPVAAFLRVTRLLVVPSCWGFSSRERCTATTSL